ncbi:hypothetical protein J3R74_000805 [Puniceicoccus vermicola]
MSDTIGLFLVDVMLHGFCYYTGKVIVKISSLGRASVEPRRRIGRKENATYQVDHSRVSDGWLSAIGFIFWVATGFLFAILK